MVLEQQEPRVPSLQKNLQAQCHQEEPESGAGNNGRSERTAVTILISCSSIHLQLSVALFCVDCNSSSAPLIAVLEPQTIPKTVHQQDFQHRVCRLCSCAAPLNQDDPLQQLCLVKNDVKSLTQTGHEQQVFASNCGFVTSCKEVFDHGLSLLKWEADCEWGCLVSVVISRVPDPSALLIREPTRTLFLSCA